ncbi:MAG: aminopeptidase [Conexibacter sp.]|nr:aminopeptidase [Conexibacter sp.]
MKRASLAAVACALLASAAVPATAPANKPKPPKPQPDYSAQLQKAVTVTGMVRHERALANIGERNGGTRASGTAGFLKSRDYVAGRLQDAGYAVTVQPFDFPFFQETSPSTLGDFTEGPQDDFTIMQYSGSGDVTAAVEPVDVTLPPTAEPSSTSGCEPEDFAGFTAGDIALVQRGTCDFAVKVDNAVAAGASAVIIFNEGQPGRTDSQGGTLGGPKDVPVLFTSFAAGDALAQDPPAALHIVTTTINETRETYNVIADSKKGDTSRTVVVGSHLDSVLEGPGINDDGSGTAQDLEIAEELPTVLKKPKNHIRFAFWGAEESGLLGSTHYVESLTQEQKDDIMANLNFDMVASPNYVRMVYDGDGSDNTSPSPPTPGPVGSDIIESIFTTYFDGRGLAHQSTAFDGRSDYGPFIDAGIPAGGTFSGAEEIKTAEEAQIYGGTAGAAYDPCYHQACDTLANLNLQAFDEFSDAAADAVVKLAQRPTDLTDNETLAKRAPTTMPFKGPEALR